MKLLTVIPTCRADSARAEKLLDMIYQLDGKVQKGSCLLVFAPDVHAEMQAKLKISAEVAFSHVDVLTRREGTQDKAQGVWQMFRATAQHVAFNYRYPWLWLEPDCLPLKPNWREDLAAAYDVQPRRYLARRMKAGTPEKGEVYYTHRVGVYPTSVLADLEGAVAAEVNFFESIFAKATFSDLFQQVQLEDAADVGKIRQNAVLAHSDKKGALVDWVLNEGRKPEKTMVEFVEEAVQESRKLHNGSMEHAMSAPPDLKIPVLTPKRRGRPPKVKPEPVPTL